MQAKDRDIERWLSKGLIDASLAQILRQEQQNNRLSLSQPTIIVLMAAILVGAAIITFVAANWQEMGRLVRLALLAAAILLGYAVGGFALMRGKPLLAEAFYIVGVISYGAAIALVGQMYHLSGDEVDAARIWLIGVAAGAFLLPSRSLALMVMALACYYVLCDVSGLLVTRITWEEKLVRLPVLLTMIYGLNHLYPGHLLKHASMMLVCTLIISFMDMVSSNFGEHSAEFFFFRLSLGGIFTVLLLTVWHKPQWVERLSGFSGGLGSWSLLLAYVLLSLIQIDITDNSKYYPASWNWIAAVVMLGLCIMGVFSSAHAGWMRKLLACTLFFIQVGYLVYNTVHSLLVQTLFFLVVATVLAAISMIMAKRTKKSGMEGALL